MSGLFKSYHQDVSDSLNHNEWLNSQQRQQQHEQQQKHWIPE